MRDVASKRYNCGHLKGNTVLIAGSLLFLPHSVMSSQTKRVTHWSDNYPIPIIVENYIITLLNLIDMIFKQLNTVTYKSKEMATCE